MSTLDPKTALAELAAAADRVAKAAKSALDSCPAISEHVEIEIQQALRHWNRTKTKLLKSLRPLPQIQTITHEE